LKSNAAAYKHECRVLRWKQRLVVSWLHRVSGRRVDLQSVTGYAQEAAAHKTCLGHIPCRDLQHQNTLTEMLTTTVINTRLRNIKDLKICDNGILIKLLTFWTLSMSCFLFKNNISEAGLLSPSSGKSRLSWAQSIELVPVSVNTNFILQRFQ
jgi:hypothetical protein